MDSDTHDFKEFMRRREAASSAFLNGDVAPLEAVSAHDLPATLFGPGGDYIVGADKVNVTNAKSVGSFAPGSTNRFEVLHTAASGDLAYWVGLQRSSARMRGQSDPVPFNLRVTEIFRREDGTWKLVHRHADPIASEQAAKK